MNKSIKTDGYPTRSGTYWVFDKMFDDWVIAEYSSKSRSFYAAGTNEIRTEAVNTFNCYLTHPINYRRIPKPKSI